VDTGMDVGRGGGRVGLGSLDFEIFSKKGDSLSFEWKKQISPLLAPMEKFRKNLLVAALEKILPTPMDTGM